MKIGQFTVAEFTAVNEHQNRVRLEGGFPDARGSIVLTTRERFKVGDSLSLDNGIPTPAEPEPAPAAEPTPVITENSSELVN